MAYKKTWISIIILLLSLAFLFCISTADAAALKDWINNDRIPLLASIIRYSHSLSTVASDPDGPHFKTSPSEFLANTLPQNTAQPCDFDLNQDGRIDEADLRLLVIAILLGNPEGLYADLDGNGQEEYESH
jgi:hypothetical protein